MPTTLRQAVKDIADAIRAKGVSGTMSLQQMPQKIANIPTGSTTKCGVDIDNLIGDLDANGVLQLPVSTPTFSFTSDAIVSIGQQVLTNKFYHMPNLTSVSLPNLTRVESKGLSSTFDGCVSLESVSMPNLAYVDEMGLRYCFCNCTSLRTVNFKKLSGCYDGNSLFYTFDGCTSLELVDFSEATAVPEVMQFTFRNTNSTFVVVVPDALYETWIATINWSSIASQIVKASDYNQ